MMVLRLFVFVVLIGFAELPVFGQTIDCTVDYPASVDCYGHYFPEYQGGYNGAPPPSTAWSFGTLINNRWHGEAVLGAYGTCRTSLQNISVEHGGAFGYCAFQNIQRVDVYENAGHVTTLEGSYLVHTGYLVIDAYISRAYGVIWEAHKRKYCDDGEPVLVQSPYVPC